MGSSRCASSHGLNHKPKIIPSLFLTSQAHYTLWNALVKITSTARQTSLIRISPFRTLPSNFPFSFGVYGMTALKKKSKPSDQIEEIERDGLYFKARGNLWTRVRTEGAFWICDLVKEGTAFTDRAQRVAMLPTVEAIEPIRSHIFERPVFWEEPSQGTCLTETTFKLANTVAPAVTPEIHCVGEIGNRVAANAAVQFKDWQYEPLARVLKLPFPRLLIADDVGLGKTTEAGLVLAHLAQLGSADRILIIAPAHLCQKWQTEMRARFGLYFEVFDRNTRHRLAKRGVRNPWAAQERIIVSQDFAKRYENLKPLRRTEWDCVVIDECHHFISGGAGMPSRLRELAEGICVQSPGLMLLSATPYRGGLAEYDSLLALLDPLSCERDELGELTSGALALRKELVVRRLKRDLPESSDFPERVLRHIGVGKDLDQAEAQLVGRVEEFLLEFKKETASGSHLAAEILQKRVSSSWPAFVNTFRAVREKNAAFHTPKWDALADQASSLASLDQRKKQAKYKAFERFLKEHVIPESKKVVVFTEYADTLDFLFECIRADFPKTSLASITGSEVKAFFGGKILDSSLSLTREDIESEFSSHESPLQILLCTDSCSEGVDFQKACSVLLHFELPWSLIRMEQRNGRIDRFGQKHPPQIFNLVYETPATPDQRILNKIAQRLDEARKEFGSVSSLIEELDAQSGSLESHLWSGTEPSLPLTSSEPARVMAQASTLFELSKEQLHQSWQFHFLCLSAVLDREPGGKARLKKTSIEGVYELSLGEHDPWDLRGLEAMYGYPSSSLPWRVTFDPAVAYERSLRERQHGIDGTAGELHFLSAFHPVMDVALRKYKNLIYQNGSAPVLVVPGFFHSFALIYETTLHSAGDRGTVIYRSLSSLTDEGAPLPDLNANLKACLPLRKGMATEKNLPSPTQWNRAVEESLHQAKNEVQNQLHRLKSQLKSLEAETLALTRALEIGGSDLTHPKKFKNLFVNARREWIKELRLPALNQETNEPQVRVQPIAVLIPGKR